MSLRLLAVAMSAALLSACAAIPPGQTPAPVSDVSVRDPQLLLELLSRNEHLLGESAEAQRQELAAAQAEFERNPGDGILRLRLALALSLPKAGPRDDARAMALLADWPAGAEPTLRRQVAQLVHRLLAEKLRVARDEARRSDTLREEHRRAEAALKECQQKLDALRAIDRDTRRQRRR